MLEALGQLAGTTLELWRYDGRALRPLRGVRTAALERVPNAPGWCATPEGEAWLAPVPDAPGWWLAARGGDDPRGAAARAVPVVQGLLTAQRELARTSAELEDRCQEIELLYTLSEVLGHTVQLTEAAQILVREVAEVVGARRASILVADETAGELRVVAARGFRADELAPVPVNDPDSVAARVFREQRIVSHDPADPITEPRASTRLQPYLGRAYLSVPILYAPPGHAPQPIGVINLTDRLGEDQFTESHRRLVAAVAHQIGAAIANATLVARDLEQQRVQRELELAHHLQLRLLPSPAMVAPEADVAARCVPAHDVGGDFYQLFRLPGRRVGAMVGDVSSHGFSAALIMALAISAAGIHAEAAGSQTEALRRLGGSLEPELQRTDMFLTLFYAVVSPEPGELLYASAGHSHAFTIPADGSAPVRLGATAPPLGLGAGPDEGDVRVPWRAGADTLLLFTDGLIDARNRDGERFGERRLLDMVTRLRHLPTRVIVDEVFAEVEAFSEGPTPPADDRTMLLLRA